MAGTDPVAPSFIAGSGPTATPFNGQVQAPFTFLTSKVMFRAQRNAAQALTSGVNNLIAFDTILEDPYGGWNSGTSTWTCPAGCSGWYELSMSAWMNSAGNNTTVIAAVAALNGVIQQDMTSEWAVNGHAGGTSGMLAVSLYGGQDTVGGYIFTTAAVSTPTATGQAPTFELCWISL